MKTKFKILSLIVLTGAMLACERDTVSPETGQDASFVLQEYNPADDVAASLISGFKAARTDAAAKRPFHDMRVDHAMWLLEAAANEARADLDGLGGAVESVPLGTVSIAAERRGQNYFVTGADMEATHAAMDAQVAALLGNPPLRKVIAIDLATQGGPSAPLPNNFTFQFEVTVLLDIAAVSPLFTCEFAPTDDWEWWNQNGTGNGNCALNNGPGIDAAMRIESAIAKCGQQPTCGYYTNVSIRVCDAIGEGVAPNDPNGLNNNLFDYKIFINTTSKPNYHTCLSDAEMDFYRDWALVLGNQYLPVNREAFAHDLIGSITFPFGQSVPKHQLNMYYGKCGLPSPN